MMQADPQNNRTEGYHLFLEPAGTLREQLQDTIASLAEEFGGPVFMPHVTVLGPFIPESESAAIEHAARLANACAPFMLTLGEAGMQDAYFRSVYLEVQESEALTALHEKAREILQAPIGTTYMPHLSLLYGNYPEERKRAALAALGAGEDASFLADRIHLYRTDGAAADWVKVAELAFAAD